ncbi:hypothetical protein CIK05_05900 [Bdellovibrio sp. qaytius]|nr:hypothetical protein CIK05_05900 [Bdellovibrio sp. qaytius]
MFKSVLIAMVLFLSQTLLAQEVLNLNAKYSVPASEDLQNLTTFEIEHFKIITNEKGVRYMSYTLPDDLTAGEPIKVMMPLIAETDTGHKTFQNQQGTAVCDGQWVALNCDIKFHDLDFSPAKVDSFLYLKYGDNKDTESRISITLQFMNNPIGKIKTDGLKGEE